MLVIGVGWTRRRTTPAPCRRQTVQPCLQGLRQRLRVDLAVALHLGASLSLCVGSLGLPSLFTFNPPPGTDIAHDGLSAAFHVHTLDTDSLLSLGSVFLKRIHLRQERAPMRVIERSYASRT